MTGSQTATMDGMPQLAGLTHAIYPHRRRAMPMTKKGAKIMGEMMEEYGAKKGKEVFYRSANKGTIKGVHKDKVGKHIGKMARGKK